MATTINLLSGADGLYSQYKDENGQTVLSASIGWSANGAVLTVVPTEFISKSRFVLRMNPSSAGEITLSLSGVPIKTSLNGLDISFNAKMKPSAESIVTVAINHESSVETGYQQRISGGIYSALQSNVLTLPDDENEHTIDIEISIIGHQGQNILMTYPNLIEDKGFYRNRMVPLSRNFMPDFYWEIDSIEEQPTAPYHRLIDILTSAINEVMREYDAIYQFERDELITQDETGEESAKSVLVDPYFVREKYIKWLSQFTGNKIKRNIEVESTGDFYFENFSAARSFVEWQLATSSYGRAAGTRNAILDAAKQVLAYTKNGNDSTEAIALTPRYNGDPWTILIRTIENETLDANSGESSALILSAVEPARPLGYKILHQTVTELSFILNDLTFGRLDEIGLGVVSAPDGAPENLTVESFSGPITNIIGHGACVQFFAANAFLEKSIVTIGGVNPGNYNYVDVEVAYADQDSFVVLANDTLTYVSGGSASSQYTVSDTEAKIWFTPLSVSGGGDGGGIIENYKYYLSTDGGFSYDSGTLLSPAKGSPPITISGLTPSTGYFVKLKAINEIGESSVFSSPISFSTKA